MNPIVSRWMCAVTVVLLCACGPSELQQPGQPLAPVPQVQNPVETSPEPLTGFPCEVREVLQTVCVGCHLGQTYAGAFSSRADFAPTEGEWSLNTRAMVRLADTQRPMPPYSAERQPTTAQRQLVLDWLAAGAPAGECGPLTRQ